MCGFIGLVSEEPQRYQKQFDDGFKTLQARGTTADVLREASASYGFCRLPTDDVYNMELAAIQRHQGAVILFNGLLTNTDRLAQHYGLGNACAQSDTVCMRSGFAAHGADFLRRCQGMFACAKVNSARIMLARDGAGVKPLYYVCEPDMFAFASELKTLAPLLRPIQEVLPGQIVTYDRSSRTLTVQNFAFEPLEPSTGLLNVLTTAVVEPTLRYLTQSDKKVALLLSGGLDSSIIAGILANHLPDQLRARLVAFCIGSPSAPDVHAARKLAQTLNITFEHVSLPSAEQLLSRLPGIVYDVESPHARVVRVALLHDELARAIKRRDIDIVIGGEGADELFFGYRRFIEGLLPAESERAFTSFYKGVFFNTLLQRFERIFARNLIEGRVPYLDQAVVRIATALPPNAKVKHHSDGGHTSKLPLRQLARQIHLPSYIYDRPKEKMTSGATGQENSTAADGFLERETRALTGCSFQELVTTLYKLFYYQNGADCLRRGPGFTTEDEVMKMVRALQTKKMGNVR